MTEIKPEAVDIKKEIRKRLELFFGFTALAIISLIAPDKALDALTGITEEEEEEEGEKMKPAKIADKPPSWGINQKTKCCVCGEHIMSTEPFTFSRPFNYLVDGTVAHADCYRKVRV